MAYGDRWDPQGWEQFQMEMADYNAGLHGLDPANPWKIATPPYNTGLAHGGWLYREREKTNPPDFELINPKWWEK